MIDGKMLENDRKLEDEEEEEKFSQSKENTRNSLKFRTVKLE